VKAFPLSPASTITPPSGFSDQIVEKCIYGKKMHRKMIVSPKQQRMGSFVSIRRKTQDIISEK